MENEYDIANVSEATFLLINNHHAAHPGEPLTLTGEQVAELAGCGWDHSKDVAAV
jgi:hypothetical protein